jgi:multiple antibiotic resistance protein
MDVKLLAVQIAQTALALFIIIDPLGGLPVFASLLRGMPPQQRRRTINLGVFVAFLVLLLFASLGMKLLGLFGVGLPELMIAGGLMLLIVGLNEVFGFLAQLTTYNENVGIVPIACPLLAGPGAIVTLMVATQRATFPSSYIILFVSATLAMAASWAVLIHTHGLSQLLGERGALILAKLMGIVVTAIGTHFILQGLLDFWRHARLAPG